tara:strand:+ start:3551 stop:3793 length:243 start_codon:yes stop_codon:yes gene_type:complete
MTPHEYNLKLSGFLELRKHRERMDWERCRWQTANLLQPHTKKGKKLKPTDLIKFDWDKNEAKKKTPTVQEIKQILLKNKI